MSLTTLIILGYLNKKNMHGYEIIQAVKEANLYNRLGIKMPSIYKALPKLEKKGFICGEQVADGNNPPKRVFTLSDSGREELEKIVTSFLTDFKRVRQEFWAGMIFMENLITKEKFKEALQSRLENFKKKRVGLAMNRTLVTESNKMPFYLKGMVKMGDAVYKAEIETMSLLLYEIDKPENEKYLKEK